MNVADKLVAMVLALAAFAAVIGLVLLVVSLLERRGARRVAWFFVGPTVLLILVGLVYPAGRTIVRSLYDAAGSSFIGLAKRSVAVPARSVPPRLTQSNE